MNIKRVVDWLSTKQIEGKPVDKENVANLLSEVEEMPCICCFGDPDLLGMTESCATERTLFYMLCLDCAKKIDRKDIYDKIQAFSLQVMN